MKTILVTGGAGFVGSHLCRKLLSMGEKVICVDNLFTCTGENISDLKKNENFSFIKHDITEPLDVDEKIDQIYNFACPASPPFYQENPVWTFKTSVFGILNMLELAKKNGARILQASTSEVYGDPLEHPQKETYLGNVNCDGIRACYDEGKRSAETLMFDYYRMYKTDIRIIRIFNTYGPGMNPIDGRVVSNFVLQAMKNEDITVYGDGSQTRSFCYVSDLVEGIVKMMNQDFIGPVNLGNPGEFTILELAKKAIEFTGSTSKIINMELPADDPKLRKPDITVAKEKLSWEPIIDLDTGLKETIKYFKDTI